MTVSNSIKNSHAPSSTECTTSSTKHPGYHFHIYGKLNDQCDQAVATHIFETAKTLKGVTSSSNLFILNPVGPHNYSQGRISVREEDKSDFTRWFQSHAIDRSILCHPKATVFGAQDGQEVPDEIPDHVTKTQSAAGKAEWIGEPLPLNLEKLGNPFKRSLQAPFDAQ